jgi:hypothetical protein
MFTKHFFFVIDTLDRLALHDKCNIYFKALPLPFEWSIIELGLKTHTQIDAVVFLSGETVMKKKRVVLLTLALLQPGTNTIKSFSGANVIKLFSSVIYDYSLQARVFVPGKPFQPSLMIVGEARSLPWSGAPASCFTRVGSSLKRNH